MSQLLVFAELFEINCLKTPKFLFFGLDFKDLRNAYS